MDGHVDQHVVVGAVLGSGSQVYGFHPAFGDAQMFHDFLAAKMGIGNDVVGFAGAGADQGVVKASGDAAAVFAGGG